MASSKVDAGMTPGERDLRQPWLSLHEAAEAQAQDFYSDPETGYRVFTASSHQRRGYCCGAACRHCPFGHEQVPSALKTERAWAPTLYWAGDKPRSRVDVVFWSGGKDSYLAWRASQVDGRPSIWLSTYDPERQRVPLQEVAVAALKRQAMRAGQSLLLVPVGAGQSYATRVLGALDLVLEASGVQRLVFGDLWLEEIRCARERMFSHWIDRHGVELHFPLWRVSTAELIDRLLIDGPEVRISASQHSAARVGDRYDRAFVAGLPADVDPMGENGEFHTEVVL